MTKYREILRLHSQGISQRNIAFSCACSRNTVSKITQRADELGITWPLEKELTDGELRQRLFAQSTQVSRQEAAGLRLHPQRDGQKRRHVKLALERVLRAMPVKSRAPAYVLAILLPLPTVHAEIECHDANSAKAWRAN